MSSPLSSLFITDNKEIPYIVCPLCGLHRKLFKNGRYAIIRKKALKANSRSVKYNPEKETRFDIVNIKDEPFISIRERLNGRGGLYEIRTLTIKEALEDPEYSDIARELLSQIKEQIERIKQEIDTLL